MSDFAIPGFSSDSNTAKQIENLMKAKSIPLEKMEIKQEEYLTTKGIWQDMNVTLSRLNDSARKLYSFENPFSNKTVVSSNEKVLTAESTRSALDSNVKLSVEQIAKGDKFSSNSIDKNYKIPSGEYSFKIGEKESTLKYRGGELSDFVSKANSRFADIARFSLINSTKDSKILLVEGLQTGKENNLIFLNDSIDIGLNLGLIKENSIQNTRIKTNDIIKSDGIIQRGLYDLVLSSNSSVDIRINEKINKNDIINIELQMKYTPNTGLKKEEVEFNDIFVPSVTYEDITITSSIGTKLDRTLINDESIENKLDLNIVKISNGNQNLNLDAIENTNDITQLVSFYPSYIEDFNSISFVNNNPDKTILIKSITSSNNSDIRDFIPVNPISIASDALITYNDMEIERSTNKIDDLVDGTTIFLHEPSPGENITLNISYDTELAKDGILDFVYNYNETVKKILILTNDDKAIISEIEFADDNQKEKAEEIHGLLKGERILNTIRQRLHSIMTSPYENSEDSSINMLKSIGISTNELGSTGVNVSKLRGYLEIDINKLDNALKNDITGVKNLFGRDTTNDFIINYGLAKSISDTLTPYTQTGGIISSRINTIDTQITRGEKEITDYKDSLVTYEATIRRKYGQMDSTINTLNNSMKAIDNLTNTGDK